MGFFYSNVNNLCDLHKLYFFGFRMIFAQRWFLFTALEYNLNGISIIWNSRLDVIYIMIDYYFIIIVIIVLCNYRLTPKTVPKKLLVKCNRVGLFENWNLYTFSNFLPTYLRNISIFFIISKILYQKCVVLYTFQKGFQ